MQVWGSLILPVLLVITLLKFFKKSLTWYEPAIPVVVCVLLIFLMKSCSSYMAVQDIEYWGSMGVEARYYESYETWVTKMCSREVACGQDDKGNTTYCTQYYDCSECESHSPYWTLQDNLGNEFEISRSKYLELVKKWQAAPAFVELHRSIDYYGSCGKDGDMYTIKWNSDVMTSEPVTSEHGYINKVQASHSAFRLPHISNSQGKKEGLYKYPVIDFYTQSALLGIDSLKDLSSNQKDSAKKYFLYFNGNNGPSAKVKLFVLLFFDKSYHTALRQQAFWDGGNKNEIVICIGMSSANKKINWVFPFSWTDQKRVLVDCREDIANLKVFDWEKVYDVCVKDIPGKFRYKDFDDFNYLTPEVTTGQVVFIWIMVFMCCIGVGWWSISNELSDFKKD